MESARGATPGFPTLYDWFAANGAPHYLMDTSLFPNPSAALAAELQSGNVWWYGLQAYGANGAPPKLYAPAVWRQGSSYSHLDKSSYPAGSPNSLMTYALGYAESIHNPGPIAIGILHDIGWNTGCTFRPVGDIVQWRPRRRIQFGQCRGTGGLQLVGGEQCHVCHDHFGRVGHRARNR